MINRSTMAALVLLSASAFGQVRVQPGVVIGFGMFKYSDSYNNPLLNYSDNSKTGWLGGGVIDIAFNGYLSLGSGIEYLERGGSYATEDDFTNTTISTTDNLDYLEIPINLKIKYPMTFNVTPYALAGLNLGYLLSATQSVTNATGTTQMDIKSEMSSVAYGFNLGGGAECNTGPVISYFELNYMYNDDGMINIPGIGNAIRHNNGFEFKAGIRFKT